MDNIDSIKVWLANCALTSKREHIENEEVEKCFAENVVNRLVIKQHTAPIVAYKSHLIKQRQNNQPLACTGSPQQ